jgi:hypothetical protein
VQTLATWLASAASGSVSVSGTEIAEVDLQVDELSAVSGIVRDAATHQPLAGARVQLVDSEGGIAGRSSVSDATRALLAACPSWLIRGTGFSSSPFLHLPASCGTPGAVTYIVGPNAGPARTGWVVVPGGAMEIRQEGVLTRSMGNERRAAGQPFPRFGQSRSMLR